MARRRGGGDKLFNQKKEEKKQNEFKRVTNNKRTVDDIVIACEDSVSAPTYFKKLVKNLIKQKVITQDSFVIVEPSHTNPNGVLTDLKSYESKTGKKYSDFDHKWIVIDRDVERVNGGGHTKEDFNNALQNAKNKKKAYRIEIAYANDSFELWYLLHFVYRDTPILRDEITKEVIKKLKVLNPQKFSTLTKDNIKKEENTNLIFDEILHLQDNAIKNAKKLLEKHEEIGHNPESDNPCTTVHKLVEIIKEIKK